MIELNNNNNAPGWPVMGIHTTAYKVFLTEQFDPAFW